MKSFLSRFGSLVLFVLTGFDRLRLAGESRLLNHGRGVQSYLWQRKILFKDFPAHAEHLTRRLRKDTKALAQEHAVPLRHLNSPDIDKEATALELAQQEPQRRGRIALLTCVESCSPYHLRKNERGLIEPRKEAGRCLHYYHSFQHERLGLCYVRIQSWFPFSVRIGLNGRQWLYRQLEQQGIDFQRKDNLLVTVKDPSKAQALLDEQSRTDWPTLLQELVQPIHPLWSYLHETVRTPSYGMIEQSEWATDFVFRSPDALALWYPRWIRHGIETTINDPSGFKVFRTKEGEAGDAPKSWQQMRKGVADTRRRAEVSQAANNRLAESLASVADTTPLGKMLEPLCQPVLDKNARRARALNPAAGPDGELLRCLADGEFLLNGFRNRDLRAKLYKTTADAKEQRQQAAAITRKLALLKAHGLIVKVQKTHRYRLSAAATRITTALATAYQADINRLADAA